MDAAASADQKPLPRVDADSRPFWESCRRHAMAIQRCAACGRFRFPPRRVCPACHSDAAQWTPVAGTGRVYVSLVVSQAPGRAWSEDVPFNLSIVELDEGVRMWGNVVGCDPDEVDLGDRVQVAYDDVAEDVTLPRFVAASRRAREQRRHAAAPDPHPSGRERR